ncbi:MFS transporter [Microlunatus parietis]|uniref:DHA1 family inner membrane transport protein n=1 Tax=Microlunatus parietis TaxID=682979 RepID=A0A7Y9IFK9_9ACTN|nr:MFS transporter [Microlunatus parietis]NYE75623.1 DHA1 family inner membrane transport protein [Microlunatus parietis]
MSLETARAENEAGSTSSARTNLALATLFLATFVLGCSEMLVIGMLDLIAADLRVSISTAGTLLTAQALGMALGGPVLTALTITWNKRIVLIGALGLTVAANLVLVLTAGFGLYLAARAFAGAAQGLFIAAGIAVAVSLVPAERTGRAMSVVISGFAVSSAVGVPLGTLAGQLLGWRGSFTAVVVLAVIALVATLGVVPSVRGTGAGAWQQARHVFAPRVLAVLGLGGLIFAGAAAFNTYMVPFLQEVTGVSGALISVFLMIFGVATTVGSYGGGRLADAGAARALILGAAGLAVSLAALFLFGGIAVLAGLALFAVGLFGMGSAPALQYRVVQLAGPGGQLAQAMPASVANLGIALGSIAGGLAIGAYTTAAAAGTGLVIAVLAVAAAVASSFLKPSVP